MTAKTIRFFRIGNDVSLTLNSIISYFDLNAYDECIISAIKSVLGNESIILKIKHKGPGGRARCLEIMDSFFVVGLCLSTKPNAKSMLDSYYDWFTNKTGMEINMEMKDNLYMGVFHSAYDLTWQANLTNAVPNFSVNAKVLLGQLSD